MATAKGKRTIGAEAEESLIDELDKRAAAEKRSRSETILRACRFYLDYAELIPADADKPKPKVAGGRKGK